jgi:uncharacterized protein YciI
MKFLNFVKYKDLDLIANIRPAHFAYADRLRGEGKLAIGGPLLDEAGQRIGLIFIYEAASSEDALDLALNDPFALSGALKSYEISEWLLRGLNVDLLIEANRVAHPTDGAVAKSPLFANYAKYKTDGSKLADVRPAHLEYDRSLRKDGKLVLAGPFANDTGGLFVYDAASTDEATTYLKQDPLAVEGVFETTEIFQWLIEGINPSLLTVDASVGTQAASATPNKQ